MIWVGTSGWQYDSWREGLYAGVPRKGWLEHYAGRFATVEVNNAFYRLPSREVFESWRVRTPGGFVVAVKMSRYLTHVKRLREPEEPVARFLERAAGLGDRLGPVLVQLPPTLRADAGALGAVLGCFPRDVRVAVEPRHPSWWSEAVRDVLAGHNAALCWADRRGRPVTPLWRTADFGYLRFHEGRASPWPRYGRKALRSWLGRMADGDWYVYFNNDPNGAAVEDAEAFRATARRQGRALAGS